MIAALPPILDGTCIATDMADVVLSAMAKLAPRSKRLRGAQLVRGPGVEAEMNAAWQQRGGEEVPTRRTPQQQPSKGREDDCQKSSEGSRGFRAELSGLSWENSKHAFKKAIRPASTII